MNTGSREYSGLQTEASGQCGRLGVSWFGGLFFLKLAFPQCPIPHPPTPGTLHSHLAVCWEVLCFPGKPEQVSCAEFSPQRKEKPHSQEHPRFPGRTGWHWLEPAHKGLLALCSVASCWWVAGKGVLNIHQHGLPLQIRGQQPWACRSSPLLVFENKSLSEDSDALSFTYCLWLLLWYRQMDWERSHRRLLWPLTEKIGNPCSPV